MGRNKKKSKQPTHVEDTHSDSESEAGSDAPVEPSPAAETVQGQDPEEASDAASDDTPKKKKKEYRGNRLNKAAEKQSKKKGKGAAPEASPAPATAATAATAATGEGAEDAEEEVVVTRQGPVEVLYCAVCTFPAEMCEFSGMMEKCRPWLQEHAAELADAEERGRKRRILTEKDRLEALVEGRGIKKALERVVVLEVEKRTGRRMITSVFGMDLFGFNLKDLSREWKKIFSCGAGVRSAEEGKHQDCIDIQGNVVDQLAELLVAKYKISKSAVYTQEGKKKKVPYFE